MARLTIDQVATVALAALGDREKAATATAIAMAESGGVTDVVSATGDYGLWQINRRAHAGKYDFDRLLSDPAYNAQAMAQISSGGTNWRPWAAYWNVPFSSGPGGDQAPYRRHLVAATAAVGGSKVGAGDVAGAVRGAITNPTAIPGVIGQVAGQLDPLAAVARFLELVTSGAVWLRVLYVAGGAVMFAAGLALLGVDLAGSGPPRKVGSPA